MTEREMFEAALEEPPERRRAYLDGICGGDICLRQRLESLMMKNDMAGSFLESPAAVLTPALDDPVSERPGTVIGPYKLLEQIGEGGMGLVFMAEQAQPIRRRVALKILKPGMDTRQVITRFEAERQALALMDHSHIAKIFDACTTDSGRPYFVMELVRGVPITEICQSAGKFDKADGPLREAIAQSRREKGAVMERNELANRLGFLAVNLLLQGRYDEAEPLAREAVAMRQVGDFKRFYWVSALGAVLLGKQNYAEAEPLLLQGYEGSKHKNLAEHPATIKRRAKVAQWLVRLYDETNQPEKAREWREKVGIRVETKTPPKTKEAKPELVPPPREVPSK